MQRRTQRILGFAVLALVTVVVAFVALSSGGGYTLTATFDQVNGLVEGADVQAGGLKVGSVERIDLGESGLPQVRMRIDDDFRMHRGGRANIRFFSVSGAVNRYVALEQGAGPELADGATLAGARTDEPVEIDQVLSTLDPATRRDVRSLLRRLDAATEGRGADIEETLRHSARALRETAALTADVRGDGDALRALLRDSRRVVGTLASDPGALGSTADELAALLRTTAAREAELAAGVGRLPGGLRSPRLALERTRSAVGELRKVVADARPAVRRLVPFARDLRPTLRAAVPALGEARSLVADGPRDLRRLDELLRTAGPVLKDLTPVLAHANPMLDELRVRLPDAFGFFANWADFASNYDANGHAARVALVFPPAPTKAIGPSDAVAGHLRRPFDRTPGVLEGEPWTNYRDSFVGGKAP
ncbi:MAG TPA: MlaD family protein [Solirubrobacteraceae bacterium]|nr:MlaD family protein [Solirubrobacteraceae bacterium]